LNLILASAAFALPIGVSATQIRNARLWRSDDKSRWVFDLSGPVRLARGSERSGLNFRTLVVETKEK
jgi:hypothetical protein